MSSRIDANSLASQLLQIAANAANSTPQSTRQQVAAYESMVQSSNLSSAAKQQMDQGISDLGTGSESAIVTGLQILINTLEHSGLSAALRATLTQNAPPSVAAGGGNPTSLADVSSTVLPDSGGPVTTHDLQSYIDAALQARAPIYSNRNLGGPANAAYWTPAELQKLRLGVQTAYQFFAGTGLSEQTVAKLIVAEAAQESTLNPNQGAGSDSVGLLQVTPSTVVQDFINHGTPITAPDGQVVVSPSGNIDLTNPAVNVALWAWYTNNAVHYGESDNEVALGQTGTPVSRDFGNLQFNWLGGPHNDRHDPADASGYQDYHDRIKDYFVQSGFGTASQFESLLNTPVAANAMFVNFPSSTT